MIIKLTNFKMAPKKNKDDNIDTSSVPKITKKVISKQSSAKKEDGSPAKQSKRKRKEPHTASPKTSGKLFGMPDISGFKDEDNNILQSQAIIAQSAPDLKKESNVN
jgi:hypothetical protein